MGVKIVFIRIEEEMLQKIGYIADDEGRPVNSHILVLIRNSIAEYESLHGRIEGEIRPEVNVKPPRRHKK